MSFMVLIPTALCVKVIHEPGLPLLLSRALPKSVTLPISEPLD